MTNCQLTVPLPWIIEYRKIRVFASPVRFLKRGKWRRVPIRARSGPDLLLVYTTAEGLGIVDENSALL